jgi:hypothetical protein
MFQRLGDFGMKRTALQAVGFYIVYLVLILVIVELLAVALSVVSGVPDSGAYQFGVGVGAIGAACVCAFLSYRILNDKRLLKNFSSIVYLIATAALALLGGGVIGLILVAFLTTRAPATQ